MDKRLQAALALLSLTGVAAAALSLRKPRLSARRRRALEAVARVVPSEYGEAKFAELAPGYSPTDPALPRGFTTCGYLPCYVGRSLGHAQGITQCGLDQLRINAKRANAWRAPNDSNARPLPGDFYGLEKDGTIVHVGVIIDASGDVWTTADAGQGSHEKQAAQFVRRRWDAQSKTLGGPAGQRPLAGWLDLDKFFAERSAGT